MNNCLYEAALQKSEKVKQVMFQNQIKFPASANSGNCSEEMKSCFDIKGLIMFVPKFYMIIVYKS